MLVVVDASVWVEYLLQTDAAQQYRDTIESETTDLHVPALCDVELISGLRRCIREEDLTISRAEQALEHYLDLPIERHGHTALLERMLELRDNFSAYDAAYAILAESLPAALVTADAPFARALDLHLPAVELIR